jgi:hypothetical protein
MTNVVSTDAERLKCLQNVLKINPNSEQAKKGLVAIQQRQASQFPTPKPKPIEAQSEPVVMPRQKINLAEHRAELQQAPPPPKLKTLKTEATKKCPYCAETIKVDAKFCRFCGRNLASGEQQQPQVIVQQVPEKKKRNSFVTFLAALGLVSLICVCFAVFSTSSLPSSRPNQQKQQPSTTSEYLLEFVSVTDERSSSYITVNGQVKNISGQSLENVTAVIEYYDANDNFVTSDSALIDYNPILPGQTSPFSVITRDNPAIKRYSTSFKFLLGGTIRTKDSRR